MYSPGSMVYMDKLAVGPEACGAVDIDAPIETNLAAIARAKNREIGDLTVIILDRPRHTDRIAEIRRLGARIKLIADGDVSAAISTCVEGSGVDVLIGVGGSPEAVITAAALKCLGGEIQCRLWPRDDNDRKYAGEHNMDLDEVLHIGDLVRGDNVFFAATGITRWRSADRCPLLWWRRAHPQCGDALQVGHHPLHPVGASLGQVDGV